MSRKKNIFLTGAPSSGKTTVIQKVIAALPYAANGFYTKKERVGGVRVGFVLHPLVGRPGYLAHQDITSEYHIRRYGVSIENIEKIAVPTIQPFNNQIIILDEIGKMECFSQLFMKAALTALNATNIVVGTITLGGEGFIKEVKERDDVEIIEVTSDNRDLLPPKILQLVKDLREI